MNQDIQSILIFTAFFIFLNAVFFGGFMKGKFADKAYDWRMKRHLIVDGVSKEEYVRSIKKIIPILLFFGNMLYALFIVGVLWRV